MAASEADLVDLYPFNGGYSVMGVDAESAVGLLGLLLFIDLMRVKFIYSEKATKFCEISTNYLSYVVTDKATVEISQNTYLNESLKILRPV